MKEIENCDYSVLHEGDVFSNYKKLCERLNVPILKANSQKAQIKEWKRHFDFERDGQKRIITEVYSTPLPKDDKRLIGNNNEYRPYIEMILLDYLSKQKGKATNITLKNLFFLLGMVNANYMDKNYEIKDADIEEWHIKHFNQRSYNKIYSIVFTSLNNLRNRRLIDYNKMTMINVNINEDGKRYNKTRQATKREEDIIRETERNVLKQMGLESIVLVFLKYKTEDFYRAVESFLSEHYDINYYYSTIEIRFTHEHIIEAKEDKAKEILNKKIMCGLNNEAETKVINSRDSSSKFEFYDEEAYLLSQRKLAEYLIRIKEDKKENE